MDNEVTNFCKDLKGNMYLMVNHSPEILYALIHVFTFYLLLNCRSLLSCYTHNVSYSDFLHHHSHKNFVISHFDSMHQLLWNRNKGILFVAIDQSRPLSDQGPFDIVLHKVRSYSFTIS